MSRYIPMPAYPDRMPVDISFVFEDEKPAGKHGFVRPDGEDLRFEDGTVRVLNGTEGCDILLRFSSPEKFNGMVDGTVTPIPVKGFTRLPFLLGKFKKLTDLLESYLRPSPEKLEDEVFLRRSTVVMFRVIAGAIAQIANHDRIGQFSASNVVDGAVKLEIPGVTKAALIVKDGVFTCSDRVPKAYLSSMTFRDVKTARDLFDGRINAVAAVGNGGVQIAGMVSQIDNVNRILSRVELYLK